MAASNTVNPKTGKSNAQVLRESNAVVAKSKAMLAQTKAEGSKSFKGSSYEKDYKAGKYDASPIPATDLNPQTPINLPAQPIPEAVTPIQFSNIALGAQQDGTFAPATTQDEAQLSATPVNTYMQMYQQAMGEMPSAEGTYAKLEKQNQIKQKQQEVNNYQSQLNSIVANSQSQQISLEGQGRGQTETFLGGEQARIQREAAIAALPVQAQLSAAQGNLEVAQQHVDKLFQLKMQDAQMQFQYKTKVADTIYDYMNKQEQVRLSQVMQKQERQYQEEQDFLKTQRSLMMSAVQQGAPADVLSGISGATNYLDAMSAAGVYAGDVLDRRIKLAQLAKLNEKPTPTGYAVPEVKSINGVDMQWNAQTGKWETISSGSTGLSPQQEKKLYTQNQTISKIDTLLSHTGFNSSVGPTGISRVALADRFGNKQDFIAGVENLIGQETLNTLIDLKAQGGTLGALSDKELQILESTASKIATWRQKDDAGNITGYNVSESRFSQELEDMKRKLQQARTDILGYDPSLIPDQESATIDLYLGNGAFTPAFSPANFY